MEHDQGPAMDESLRELVEVRALKVFGLDDRLVQVGDVVRMPRHKAHYADFLQLVTLHVHGDV